MIEPPHPPPQGRAHVLDLARSRAGTLDRDGARTTSALAVAERVRPQSMAQTIAELADEGLVTRRPDPDDRRQTLIELTELGRETLEAERARREGWLATSIQDGLSPSEQETLAKRRPAARPHRRPVVPVPSGRGRASDVRPPTPRDGELLAVLQRAADRSMALRASCSSTSPDRPLTPTAPVRSAPSKIATPPRKKVKKGSKL